MPTIDHFLDVLDAVIRKDWDRLVEASSSAASHERNNKKIISANKIEEAITNLKSSFESEDIIIPSSSSFAGFEFLQKIDTTTLEDIFLDEKLEKDYKLLIKEWGEEKKLKELGLSPRCTLLLHGPPGSGKTLLAKHIARELNMPLYLVRFDSLISSYLGQTASNLKHIFTFAAHNRAIIFLDEIDAIAKSRTDTSDLGELKRVVISLLQNIDSQNSKSLIVAATNHPQVLDTAIWRRFEAIWEFHLLSSDNIINILKKNFPTSSKAISLMKESLIGLSASDVATIIRNGKRRAVVENLEADESFFLSTINFIISNGERGKTPSKPLLAAVKGLKQFSIKNYTYLELEAISGIPHSTIHTRMKPKEPEC